MRPFLSVAIKRTCPVVVNVSGYNTIPTRNFLETLRSRHAINNVNNVKLKIRTDDRLVFQSVCLSCGCSTGSIERQSGHVSTKTVIIRWPRNISFTPFVTKTDQHALKALNFIYKNNFVLKYIYLKNIF